MSPAQALRRLEAMRLEFGAGRGAEKLGLLRVLARRRLGTAGAVVRLHEQLCFMRAYPDDRNILSMATAILRAFAHRADLRRHRAALDDSGIAGTRIRYRFFWPTARRLAARFPQQLDIDWDSVDEPELLAKALPLITTPVEAAWLRARNPVPQSALARLAGKAAGEGAFLVRCVEAMPGDDATREAFFDMLDTPMQITPGQATPSRTLAWHARSPASFVTAPLRSIRPDLRAELSRPPRSVRLASAAEGAQLIDLAHAALVTRSRDIDGITFGDPRDVWIADDGRGLQWAFIGIAPERRQVLRATYGFVTLRSGVPIGYGQMDTLFRCADVSFNSFDTFRGAETAWIFTRLLAACRAVLGACAFTLDGYQLGHDNAEALASGAWWFYYKLGFRPRESAIARIARVELARMRKDPDHRSGLTTLRRLAAGTMVFESGGVRAPDWLRIMDIGAKAATHLASIAGGGRQAAVRELSARARQRLAPRSFPANAGRRAGKDLAWERWALIVALLPVERWTRTERRALAGIIAAKGGRSEREFLRRFDAHPRIAADLRALCRT
jgi:hypothetical protein